MDKAPQKWKGPHKDGFLNSEDAGNLRRRGFHLPPGRHIVFESARFEPPCFLNPGLNHFRGSIGAFSYSHSSLDAVQKVGRYCSIAAASHFGGTDHPVKWISTSAFSYNRESFWGEWLKSVGEPFEHHALDSTPARRHIEFGNDVWIGTGCWIRIGTQIGDGAVIAAHSVVTKHVDPFTIVGGNPARIIRQRFEDRVIEKILRLKWWNYKFPDFNGLPVEEPERFLDLLEARIAKENLQPYRPRELTGGEIMSLLKDPPYDGSASNAAGSAMTAESRLDLDSFCAWVDSLRIEADQAGWRAVLKDNATLRPALAALAAGLGNHEPPDRPAFGLLDVICDLSAKVSAGPAHDVTSKYVRRHFLYFEEVMRPVNGRGMKDLFAPFCCALPPDEIGRTLRTCLKEFVANIESILRERGSPV